LILYLRMYICIVYTSLYVIIVWNWFGNGDQQNDSVHKRRTI